MFSEKLHRRGQLGKVEVHPFALSVTLHDLKLLEPDGDTTFASFDALAVNLSSESLLRLAPVIQEVRLNQPYIHLVRRDAYHYNIDDLIELAFRQPPSDHTARFSINNIQIEDGRIEFHDRPRKTTHAVTRLTLGIPFVSSLPSKVNIFVEPLLRGQVDGAPLLFKGKARPFAEAKDAVVELDLHDLDLARYAEYLPFAPGFRLRSGQLDAHLVASFRQPKDAAPALLLAGDASLKSAQLTQPDGAQMIKLSALHVTLGNTNVFGGPIALTKVVVNGLQTELTRERDGRLNLQRLLPPRTAAAAPAAKSAPLHIALDELEVHDGVLRYADETAPRPLHAGVEKFSLTARKLAIDTGNKTVSVGDAVSDSAALFLRQGPFAGQAAPAAHASPRDPQDDTAAATGGKASGAYDVRVDRLKIDNWSARVEDKGTLQPVTTIVAPIAISMRGISTAAPALAQVALNATVNKTGRLALNGKLGFAPFRTDLDVDLNSVDILPLQPLIADKINLRITRASLSSKGKLKLEPAADGSLSGGFNGDASLDNLATVDEVSGNDFLRWKSLAAGGMQMRIAPFALAVDNLALTDFFARVIIAPDGRINLQDIARGSAGNRKSLTETAEPAPAVRPNAAAASGAAAPAAPARKLPPISIRRLAFQGGRVRFSDNFIKPNYSASLSSLAGVVAGLSSDPSATASVDVRGEVNRAPLSIVGRVNPLREDLLLDLKANVRGMELVGLSPYADRYIGYGIEKGKISFEAAYHVENRQLSAANRLILDQLTLSEKSASPGATKLPVKLAIALLQDRNGIIDVNVPIEGSLDDPQFSIGGIILKVIGNAVAKAVSQPFAVLGSLFGSGGNAELSSVSFEPGRAAIQPAAEKTLNSLATALANRPALQLEITGWADQKTDYDGLKRATIDRKVRAEKQKDLQARGQFAELGSIVVTADEYPALLARVYSEARFAKPRNLIGLAKSLPVPDMEKLISANTVIDENDLNALANRRAQAVKDWLLKFGKIPGERIFLLASRAGHPDAQESGAASSLSKVDFSLK